MNIKLKISFVVALLFLAICPLVAQEKADTTYTFRFVPQKDMFYVPWNGNDRELARLLECVRRNKDSILGGSLPLYVDGYCNSLDSERENLRIAAIRSNRVKSELIVRGGITEECFVTKNHAADSLDCVVVTIRVAPNITHDVEANDSQHTDGEKGHTEVLMTERADKPVAHDAATGQQAMGAATHEASPSLPSGEVGGAHASLSLRANLLRWATLTPDLGLEWRVHPSWGILVNGSWTSWSWNGKDRRYALWEVMPEVRYYIGKEKCGYLGAMFKAGEFNYKLSATGKQGDLMGGGITGGYLLRLNKALSLDFSVAIGCLHADYEKYEVTDGVRVRRGTETKNWWGPVNAGVTLVYLFK